MREYSFPDYYTEWDTLRDIKSGDIENVKAYLSAINNNDYIGAGTALTKLKNKVLLTADWQERFDTVCEMHLYMDTVTPANNYNQTLHLVNNTYADPKQSLKSITGNLWFDTSYGTISCDSITASITSITVYKGLTDAFYIDIIPTPYNTTDTISFITNESNTDAVVLKDKGRRLYVDPQYLTVETHTYKVGVSSSKYVEISIYVLNPKPASVIIANKNDDRYETIKTVNPKIYIESTEPTAESIPVWTRETGTCTLENAFTYDKSMYIDITKYSSGQSFKGEVYLNGLLQSKYTVPSDATETRERVCIVNDPKYNYYNISFEIEYGKTYYTLKVYIYTSKI